MTKLKNLAVILIPFLLFLVSGFALLLFKGDDIVVSAQDPNVFVHLEVQFERYLNPNCLIDGTEEQRILHEEYRIFLDHDDNGNISFDFSNSSLLDNDDIFEFFENEIIFPFLENDRYYNSQGFGFENGHSFDEYYSMPIEHIKSDISINQGNIGDTNYVIEQVGDNIWNISYYATPGVFGVALNIDIDIGDNKGFSWTALDFYTLLSIGSGSSDELVLQTNTNSLYATFLSNDAIGAETPVEVPLILVPQMLPVDFLDLDGHYHDTIYSTYLEKYSEPSREPQSNIYQFDYWRPIDEPYYWNELGIDLEYYNKYESNGKAYDLYFTDPEQRMFEAVGFYKDITIKFNDNGGSGGPGSKNITYNDKFPDVEVPTREGHIFSGYFTAREGGTMYVDETGKGIKTNTFTSTTELFAQWQKEEYTIKFIDKFEGDEHLTAERGGLFYDTIVQDLPQLEREGYQFKGWARDPEETNSSRIYKTSYKVEDLGENKTIASFYSIWQPIRYIVYFYGGGSTGGSMSSQAFIYNEPQNLTANGFTKKGYTFVGWKYDENKPLLKDGHSIGNKVITDPESQAGNLVSENYGSISLTAQWEANHYTIKYHANYDNAYYEKYKEYLGEDSFEVECVYDEYITIAENPFIFIGHYFYQWSTKSEGTGSSHYELSETKNLVTSGTYHLYANWGETWSCLIDDSYQLKQEAVGNKTRYYIGSPEDLAWLSREMQIRALKGIDDGFDGCQFIQTSNIDLKGIIIENNTLKARYWIGIGNDKLPFQGSYNGGNYEIKNILMDGHNLGIFGATDSAQIYNVKINNGILTSTHAGGGIVAKAKLGEIKNCIVIGFDLSSRHYYSKNISGGIIGVADGTKIESCLYLSEANIWGLEQDVSCIDGENIIGGIVGCVENTTGFSTTIKNCYVKAFMKGRTAGGIVGYAKGSVEISSSGFVGVIDQRGIDTSKIGFMVADAQNWSAVTISDCFAKEDKFHNQFSPYYNYAENMTFEEGANITNSLLLTDNKKYAFGGNYENWVVTLAADTTILPKGFSWISSSMTTPIQPGMVEDMFGYISAEENGKH